MNRSRPKTTKKQQTSVAPSKRSKTTRVASMTSLRAFSSFSGPAAGNHTVYASGTFTRVAGENKHTFPVVQEFVASPDLNIVGKINHLFTKGQPLSISSTRSLYLNKEGTAAKVKSLSADEILKDGEAKFTGAPFAWTGAKITEVYKNGTKVDSEYTFDKKVIKVKTVATGQDAYTETGTLDIVSPPEFQARYQDAKKLYASTAVDDKDLIQLY